MNAAKKSLFRNEDTWHIAPDMSPTPLHREQNHRGGRTEKSKDAKPQKNGMKAVIRESELWGHIVDDVRLREDVGEYGVKSYLSKLTLRADTGTKLILEYPKALPIMWVELNYMDAIVHSVTRLLGEARSIELVEAGAEQAEQEPQASAESHAEQAEAPEAAPAPRKRRAPRGVPSFNSGLNEDYTFDNFVVGDNSRFAYIAAKNIVENPGKLYNPLFIHGGPGLGKTHLLQSIGNMIRKNNEETRVLYVTSEDFANDYIDALSRKVAGLNNFRRKYRKADVLLIDDIQFLAQKDKTQDEFFHTFNALFASGKQIVLCADCPASDVIGMDERLTSRFEQGLSVALQPPAYETRIAILRNKRAQWKSGLISDEVIDFLAKNITRSVRRLEGALTRLASFASFSHHSPTLQEARMQLKDFFREETPTNLTIKDIQQSVADEFEIRVADLNGRRRTANIAHPRQIAMFLARHHTGCSLQDIGSAFGGRDHGTVIHATRTIEAKMAQDEELKSRITRILTTLGA